MKRLQLTLCGIAAIVTAAFVSPASLSANPAAAGTVTIKVNFQQRCHDENGEAVRASTATFKRAVMSPGGKVRVRNHFVGSDFFAWAEDLDGHVTGREIKGWFRSIDSEHGMGSGSGGSDCSTGPSQLSPPPESWVPFRGSSNQKHPRYFVVTAGEPRQRPNGSYNGPAPSCAGRKADVVGTPRTDRIIAPSGSVVSGRGGDDYIAGRNLTVCAGPGRDQVTITRGAGLVFGGAGEDEVLGGPAWDVVYGGPGGDWLRGGRGANTIYGGPDNDVIDGGEDGVAWLFGGPGADRITGGSVLFG
jgi:hypothetical protein